MVGSMYLLRSCSGIPDKRDPSAGREIREWICETELVFKVQRLDRKNVNRVIHVFVWLVDNTVIL